jgi:putative ABC transport system ATP-binding protein
MLRLEEVSKVYRTRTVETTALRKFSLQVGEGEFVAVTGPSGSGKTTLLSVAGLLESFTSGEYWLDGTAVRTLSDDRRSSLRNEKIGFVFQAFNLIHDLTVAHNVAVPLHYRRMARAERRERVRAALARVGLTSRADHFPGELSGGQQQRVAIARALAGQPRVLLADEPTGNLDSETATAVMELLHELHHSGATIVMVTHDPQLAAGAQRQVRIVDGALSCITCD